MLLCISTSVIQLPLLLIWKLSHMHFIIKLMSMTCILASYYTRSGHVTKNMEPRRPVAPKDCTIPTTGLQPVPALHPATSRYYPHEAYYGISPDINTTAWIINWRQQKNHNPKK